MNNEALTLEALASLARALDVVQMATPGLHGREALSVDLMGLESRLDAAAASERDAVERLFPGRDHADL